MEEDSARHSSKSVVCMLCPQHPANVFWKRKGEPFELPRGAPRACSASWGPVFGEVSLERVHEEDSRLYRMTGRLKVGKEGLRFRRRQSGAEFSIGSAAQPESFRVSAWRCCHCCVSGL